MPQISRRKTLKGFAFTIPAVWTAPVVLSVAPPAHGQTSLTEPPVQTDIIEARSFACGDAESCELFTYSLANGGLVRSTSPCSTGPGPILTPPDTPPGIKVVFYVDAGRNRVSVLGNSPAGSFTFTWAQSCPPDDPSSSTTLPRVRDFEIDGVPYTVSLEYGRIEDPASVFVSDITVEPASP